MIAFHVPILYNHNKLSELTPWMCSDGWTHASAKKSSAWLICCCSAGGVGTACRRWRAQLHVPAWRCTAGWPCAGAGWPPPAGAEPRGRAAGWWPRPRGSGARSDRPAPRGLLAWVTPSQTANAESASLHFKFKKSSRIQFDINLFIWSMYLYEVSIYMWI